MTQQSHCLVKSCLPLRNPMDIARQAPLSVETSRQEYWSELLLLSPVIVGTRHYIFVKTPRMYNKKSAP